MLEIIKILKRFYMDKSHLLHTPMILRSLDLDRNPFRPEEKDEELLGPEVTFLSIIRAILYLANYALLDIEFVVNSLARCSSSPIQIY